MITTAYVNEDCNIILMTSQEEWKLNDLMAAVERVHGMMRSTPEQKVHLIVDILKGKEMTTFFSIASLARGIEANAPPNHGCVVIITQDRFYQQVIRFAQRIARRAGQQVYFAGRLTQALKILDEALSFSR